MEVLPDVNLADPSARLMTAKEDDSGRRVECVRPSGLCDKDDAFVVDDDDAGILQCISFVEMIRY